MKDNLEQEDRTGAEAASLKTVVDTNNAKGLKAGPTLGRV